MRTWLKFGLIGLLVCALILSLAACAAPTAGDSLPVPSVPNTLSPDPSLGASAPSGQPSRPNNDDAVFGSDAPSATGDIPAIPPDEETFLTYTVGEESITASALQHYSLHGYSIIYDADNAVCNAFGEGEAYWFSEGNYLSVSLIFGMSTEDVLAGLRLGENIAMDPEATNVGKLYYSANTLYLTTSAGIYRQFWVLAHGDDVLLVEQSYDTLSSTAPLCRASQLAMLETLLLSQ